MSSVMSRISTAIAAAALISAGAAHARQADEDGGFNLRGAGAAELPDLLDSPEIIAIDPAALQAAADAPVAGAELAQDGDRVPQGDPSATPGSSLPWHQRFTSAEPASEFAAGFDGGDDAFSVSTGNRWGVTLGISERPRGPQQFDFDDLNAGAFVNVTPRVRIGADLRFVNPEEDIFGEEVNERSPEIKFESAFRF